MTEYISPGSARRDTLKNRNSGLQSPGSTGHLYEATRAAIRLRLWFWSEQKHVQTCIFREICKFRDSAVKEHWKWILFCYVIWVKREKNLGKGRTNDDMMIFTMFLWLITAIESQIYHLTLHICNICAPCPSQVGLWSRTASSVWAAPCLICPALRVTCRWDCRYLICIHVLFLTMCQARLNIVL